MATQIPNFYTINGVIDTSKSVLENMNLIAEAAGCWMTYDINEGKWAVIINNTGSSVASFNDSNILGSINITSPGLTEVYNTVEMQFPHRDLIDEPDYVTMSVAAGNRYPNEPDNVLSISSQLINNQAQAQSIAGRQLKQSRIDKIINFQADYSYIGLKAGDLVSVTNSIYSWSSKVFRITSIQEQNADDGNIIMDITALEYDAGVYSTADLQITPRNIQNGITASYLNSAITQANNQNTVKSLSGYGIPIYDSLTNKYVTSAIQNLISTWIGLGAPDYYSNIKNAANLAVLKTTTPVQYSWVTEQNAAQGGISQNSNFYPWLTTNSWTHSIHFELPQASMTFNSNSNILSVPFYVVVYYAPVVTAGDFTTVPADSAFTLARIARSTSKNQNIHFYISDGLDGWYLPLLIPAPDIGSNYANITPTVITDVQDDGEGYCGTVSSYFFFDY